MIRVHNNVLQLESNLKYFILIIARTQYDLIQHHNTLNRNNSSSNRAPCSKFRSNKRSSNQANKEKSASQRRGMTISPLPSKSFIDSPIELHFVKGELLHATNFPVKLSTYSPLSRFEESYTIVKPAFLPDFLYFSFCIREIHTSI